jgi:hypothetical protein
VLFLGFAAAIIGVMLIAFNSGQVSNAKMRAMNAADAAAYSGAVWQARSLNFQAYMNRAMVANEVAIAQSVSLRAWTQYVYIFTRNASVVTSWIPVVGPAVRAVERVMNAVNRGVQSILPAGETVNRVVSQAEHAGQGGMHLAGALVFDLALEVAKSNGAALSRGGEALLLVNANAWKNFTDTYSQNHGPQAKGGDGRARLREVALNSRDGFSYARDFKLGNGLAEIRKQGGTDLIDYDAWVGLDSACLRVLKDCILPLGWGGAQAYSPRMTYRIGKHGEVNDWNSIDGALARPEATRRPNAADARRGFPGYRDLKAIDKKSKVLPLAVEVVVKDSAIPSAGSALQAKAALTNGTTLEHDPHYPASGGGVYAVAEACVTFERPHNWPREGATEYASLFSPYWRASLATESRTTRVVVDGLKKLLPITATKGEGSCR